MVSSLLAYRSFRTATLFFYDLLEGCRCDFAEKSEDVDNASRSRAVMRQARVNVGSSCLAFSRVGRF